MRPPLESFTSSKIGIIFRDIGDLERAIEYHSLHLRLNEEAANVRSVDVALGNLGFDYFWAGKLDTANEYFSRHFELANNSDLNEGKAFSLFGLSNIALTRRDFDKTEKLLCEAIHLYTLLPFPFQQGVVRVGDFHNWIVVLEKNRNRPLKTPSIFLSASAPLRQDEFCF